MVDSNISFDTLANNIVAGTETLCGVYANANTLLGYSSGISADTVGRGTYGYRFNLALGAYTCSSATDTVHTYVLGHESGQSSLSSVANILIGPYSGISLTDTRDSLFVGTGAGAFQQTGKNNLFVGTSTGSNVGIYNSCNIVLGNESFQTASLCTGNIMLGHDTYISDCTNVSDSLVFGNAISGTPAQGSILLGHRSELISGTLSSLAIGHGIYTSVPISNSLLLGHGISTPSLTTHIVLGTGISAYFVGNTVSQTLNVGGSKGTDVSSQESNYQFPRLEVENPALLQDKGIVLGELRIDPETWDTYYHTYANTAPKVATVFPGLVTNPTIGILDFTSNARDQTLVPQYIPDASVVCFGQNFPAKTAHMPTLYSTSYTGFHDKLWNAKFNGETTLVNFAKNRIVLYGNFLIRNGSTLSYTVSDYILKNTVRHYDQVTRPYRVFFPEYSTLYDAVYDSRYNSNTAVANAPTLISPIANTYVDFPEQTAMRMFHIRDADADISFGERFDYFTYKGAILVDDTFPAFSPIGYVDERGTVSDPPAPGGSNDFWVVYDVCNLTTPIRAIATGEPSSTQQLSLGKVFRIDSFYDLSDYNPGLIDNIIGENILFYYGSNYTGSIPSFTPAERVNPIRFDITYSNVFFCQLSDVGFSNVGEQMQYYYKWKWFRSVSATVSDSSYLPTSGVDPGIVCVDSLSTFWINIGGFLMPGSDPPTYTDVSWIPILTPGPGQTLDVSSIYEQTIPFGVQGGFQEKTFDRDYADIPFRTVSYNAYALGSNVVLATDPNVDTWASATVSQSLLYPVYGALAVGTLSV